jgi:PRTRC genetic system protein A
MAQDKDKPKEGPNLDVLKSLIDVTIGIPGEGFSKPLTYTVARHGLYEVKSIPTARIIRKISPDGVEIPTLTDTLQAGIYLTVPKIPWTHIESILAFFKAVYEKHKSEAYASVWFDPVDKTYSVHIPEQTITGASVKHEQDHDSAGNMIHVLDIHSHASMSAFFSGGDDADEQRAERFYGVVGNLDKQVPQWKFRIRINGGFVDINPTLILEASTQTMPVTYNLVDALSHSGNAKDNKVTFEVEVNPFAGTFPPEWMDKLKTFSGYNVYTRGGHHEGYPFHRGGKGTLDTFGQTKGHEIIRFPPRPSKKERKKGVIYIYLNGTCYREYPDGHREEVLEWPGSKD